MAAALLLVAPMTRAADGPEAARLEEASGHFDRALTLFEDGDFAAALVEFRRAHAIKPSYKVRFNIGGVCLELRDHACALTEFRAYLDEGGDSVGADRRDDVRKKIAHAELRVATVEIAATPGAEIAIDDEVVGVAPLAHRVIVNVGRHRVSAQKPGWTSKTAILEASPTDALRISLELPEIERAVPVPTFPAPESPLPSPSPSRWTTASFVGLGTGGALLTAAIITGVSAEAMRADIRAERFAGPTPPPELEERADRAQALATAANVVGAAAIATIGVTLGITLFRPLASGRAAQVGVAINPTGGGFHGTF